MTTMSRDVDVLLISDLRFPGGTSHSIATEIEAQHAAGYTTGLVHLNGPLVRKVRAVNPAIARLVRSGAARLLVGPRPVTAKLVVFRHPGVLQAAAAQLPPITAEHVVVLANSGPRDHRGELVYDIAEADRAARERLGVAPVWAPIGPLVRDEIAASVPAGRLAPEDWVNIIDVDAWHAERDSRRSDRPVVGRHSRPSAQKWPADAETLRAVYPVDGSWQVRVLGGADPVERVLGKIPTSWQVLAFGAMSPQEFLAGLDFFAYYHDPRWLEAFGRTILEAIASGLPAILPPHFRPLFGDAAVYAEPNEVRGVVEGLYADRDRYEEQARRATAVARERFSFQTHVRRVAALIGEPETTPAETAQPRRQGVALVPALRDRPTVLLMSSNGAGMGHLTRLLSYAGRLGEDAHAHVLSMSQAAPVAGRLGYPYEYLPSAKALDMPPGRWQPMFVDRAAETVDRVGADVVVFDGTWPYNGIEEIRARRPQTRWVWSRRGMWRAGMNTEQLAKAAWFDDVIEPGDLAAAYDAGATVGTPAHRVGPVTLVDPADLADRQEAREALGLPLDGPLALVSLGAGNINDTSGDLGAAAAALERLGVGVCVTVPGIAADAGHGGAGVHLVRDYPLSRRYRAFDVVISASGYNSFHELLRLGVPSLFVPNTATKLDDQEGRARFAVDQGWAHQLPALTVETASPLLEDLLTRGTSMVAGAQAADPGNGATEAAGILVRLANGERP
ncbi:glycosyltransferase [Georgenia sp. MJ173]|uniref:glycosyltransferase n=1 Tax=Georgenia sunbinii TaxID=3117728 RepID=UPI002F262367